MHFSRLVLENFGPFQKAEFEFAPSGLTVISGPNGSGKSQLVGAILFSLLGKQVVDYVPSGQLPCIVELSIKDERITQTITSTVSITGTNEYHHAGEEPYFDHATTIRSPQVDSAENLGLIMAQYLRGPAAPNLLFKPDAFDKRVMSDGAETIHNVVGRSKEAEHIWHEIVTLVGSSQPFGSLETLSAGSRSLLALMLECASRLQACVNIPLAMEGPGSLDSRGLDIALRLLQLVGEKSQVIVLTSNGDQWTEIQNRIYLDWPTVKHTSAVNYAYGAEKLAVFSEVVPRPTLSDRYVLNQPVQIEEGRFYEFKEVKGGKPVNTIRNVTEQYVVAFLNAEKKQPGTVFWGIRNADRTVVGVPLTYDDRDSIRRILSEKFAKILPFVSSETYDVKIHPVYSSDGLVVDGRYIVAISVPPGSSEYLYSTGSNEVFLKTDGGKQKLTALQIQEELLRRRRLQPK